MLIKITQYLILVSHVKISFIVFSWKFYANFIIFNYNYSKAKIKYIIGPYFKVTLKKSSWFE